MFYLCLDPAPPAEREFRELAYSLHHDRERRLIQSALGKPDSDPDDMWEMVRTSDIHALSENLYFARLTLKQQHEVLAGRAPFLRDGEIGRRCARDPWLRGVYKLFSNPVHGTAMGVALAQRSKNTRQLDFEELVALSGGVATRFGTQSIRGYLRLRTYIARFIPSADRIFVRQMSEAPRPWDMECFRHQRAAR